MGSLIHIVFEVIHLGQRAFDQTKDIRSYTQVPVVSRHKQISIQLGYSQAHGWRKDNVCITFT